LKQVLARTYEIGAGGEAVHLGWSLRWHVGAYRTLTRDDIFFVSSAVIGRAFFQNIGRTRRQGLEASFEAASGPWRASASYDYSDATFRDALSLSSPENPSADADGKIEVAPGNHIPNVPAHRFKAAVAYSARTFDLSLTMRAAGGAYLDGDEANSLPK